MEHLDDIDAQILHLMQERGRIKRKDVAEAVGLSLPSASERINKLEARGVITGYHATVDAKRLHIDVTAFVRVSVDGSEHYPDFIAAVTDMDAVLELHSITGGGSHLLKVRVPNTTGLEQLLADLQRLDGVRGTETSIVLTSLKETRYLAVESGTAYEPADAEPDD